MTRNAVFHSGGSFDDGSPITSFPSAVASVFGRTGAIVAVTGDYYGAVAAALTGATQASRYVGATASGAPVSGTFVKGDWVVAQDGHIFVCTSGGTPGTWIDVGGTGGGAPTGPAGGSLSGTYPNPGIAAGAVGAAELASTAVTPATYGDASHVAQVTFDADGRAIAASSIAIPGVGAGGSVKLYDFEITGSDQASIDTNVDGTTVANFAGYTILDFWILHRITQAVVSGSVLITVNNDASAVYDFARLEAYNVSTLAGGGSVAGNNWSLDSVGANAAAGYFTATRGCIPFYAGTVAQKAGEMTQGSPNTALSSAGTPLTALCGLGYRSTLAITRIKVAAASGNLKVGSRLVVYGR